MQGEESSDDSDFLAGESSSSEDESVAEGEFDESDIDYESGEDPDKPKRKRKKRGAGGNKGPPRYDPLAPKRPLSEYMLFNQEMNPKIRAEDPTLPITEVSKKVGALWKTIDSETKAKYAEMAANIKAKYEEALSRYIPSEGYDQRGRLIKEDTPAAKKAKKDPSMPKPARSAYAYYAAEMRDSGKFEGTAQEISKKMGAAWKELDEDAKKPWTEKSAKDKKRYKEEIKAWEAKNGKNADADEGSGSSSSSGSGSSSDSSSSSGSDSD
uniref:HMG box domain-containing protein n=1 Tax=Aplanochytrium stocchinoi TaxID=215587 RepID=A0A7S3PG15_9STRA